MSTTNEQPLWIEATWPAPADVRALTTTRHGGVSEGAYASMNLATHVGDDPAAVRHNRSLLLERLALPSPPHWLNQVHGTEVMQPGNASPVDCTADAAYSDQPGQVLAVLTADCLPVTFASHDGQEIAVAHAGWRGLAAGVLEQTVARFSVPPDQMMAWLGPAIGPEHYEVGPEVREAFLDDFPADAGAFRATVGDRYLADLFTLARGRLRRLGMTRVFGGERCTYAQPELFYSYRRDGDLRNTGRMATLIWREA